MSAASPLCGEASLRPAPLIGTTRNPYAPSSCSRGTFPRLSRTTRTDDSRPSCCLHRAGAAVITHVTHRSARLIPDGPRCSTSYAMSNRRKFTTWAQAHFDRRGRGGGAAADGEERLAVVFAAVNVGAAGCVFTGGCVGAGWIVGTFGASGPAVGCVSGTIPIGGGGADAGGFGFAAGGQASARPISRTATASLPARSRTATRTTSGTAGAGNCTANFEVAGSDTSCHAESGRGRRAEVDAHRRVVRVFFVHAPFHDHVGGLVRQPPRCLHFQHRRGGVDEQLEGRRLGGHRAWVLLAGEVFGYDLEPVRPVLLRGEREVRAVRRHLALERPRPALIDGHEQQHVADVLGVLLVHADRELERLLAGRVDFRRRAARRRGRGPRRA